MIDPWRESNKERRPEIPACWSQGPVITQNSELCGWQIYWEHLSDNQQLFREQSEEYVGRLQMALRPNPQGRVLDFGCGFGYVAEMLASRVERVFIWDASANMRWHASLRLAEAQNVTFLDLSDRKALPQDLRADLILVNSVVQYMTFNEFSEWLFRWRDMLAPEGSIVVSDLIPPDYIAAWDIVDLLRLSKRRGFLRRALWQAVGEIYHYWSIRHSCPLHRVGQKELSESGTAAGLRVSFLADNLTHFTKRFTSVFTRERMVGRLPGSQRDC